MRRYGRVWRAVLIALAGAGALSGCYYDPYTGGWYASPPYYAYPMAYPYGPGYPYPYPPGQRPNPAQGYPPGPGPTGRGTRRECLHPARPVQRATAAIAMTKAFTAQSTGNGSTKSPRIGCGCGRSACFAGTRLARRSPRVWRGRWPVLALPLRWWRRLGSDPTGVWPR